MTRQTASESTRRHVLSGTELRRRRFRGPDGSPWEAVAAWDEGPHGSFLAPRVYFRHLTDPDVPHILGPSAEVWSMSDHELRAVLVRSVCARATHADDVDAHPEVGDRRAPESGTDHDPERAAWEDRHEEAGSDRAAYADTGDRDPTPTDGGLGTALPGAWLPDFDDSFDLVEFGDVITAEMGRSATG